VHSEKRWPLCGREWSTVKFPRGLRTVNTVKFPRGLRTVNNSRSVSCTQFPHGRGTRSTQAATIICAAALVMFFTLISIYQIFVV
jgi:hypothetical protein